MKNVSKDKIKIIYQDKAIIVVDKPSGLLTMATAKEKEKTLFAKVINYEKEKNKSNKVFIVHRLDKDTSGVIVFAKTELVKRKLQDDWEKMAKYRGYVAIVEGVPEKEEATLKSWLKDNITFMTYSSNKPNDGKEAITHYKIIKKNKRFSMLDINIKTGRKNQIRVQLSDIGHPILGDKKYGAVKDNLRRLALHANKLELIHPITNEVMTFTSKVPNNFNDLFIDKSENKN